MEMNPPEPASLALTLRLQEPAVGIAKGDADGRGDGDGDGDGEGEGSAEGTGSGEPAVGEDCAKSGVGLNLADVRPWPHPDMAMTATSAARLPNRRMSSGAERKL